MRRVIVGFELPRGETLDGVVRDFRRIVEGNVGANYRLRVLPRTDGSSPIEIAWPVSSDVSPRVMLVCLSLRDTLPNFFRKTLWGMLRSNPTLTSMLARANPPLPPKQAAR